MDEKKKLDEIKIPPRIYDGMPCLVCDEGHYREYGQYSFTCDHCGMHWNITPATPLVD